MKKEDYELVIPLLEKVKGQYEEMKKYVSDEKVIAGHNEMIKQVDIAIEKFKKELNAIKNCE